MKDKTKEWAEGRRRGIGLDRHATVQTRAKQGRLTPISGPVIDGNNVYPFDKEALLVWRHERLTFGEAMDLLGVSKATLQHWVEQGKLRPLEDMGGKPLMPS